MRVFVMLFKCVIKKGGVFFFLEFCLWGRERGQKKYMQFNNRENLEMWGWCGAVLQTDVTIPDFLWGLHVSFHHLPLHSIACIKIISQRSEPSSFSYVGHQGEKSLVVLLKCAGPPPSLNRKI